MGKYFNQGLIPPQGHGKRSLSKKEKGQVALTLFISVVLLFIYFGTMNLPIAVFPAGALTENPIYLGQIVCVGYWVIFAGFLMAYLIYNRGFSRKNMTEDMLPATWSQEQRANYIADGKRRYERSKWMLAIIVPFLVSIAADALYLFTWPIIQSLFNIS